MDIAHAWEDYLSVGARASTAPWLDGALVAASKIGARAVLEKAALGAASLRLNQVCQKPIPDPACKSVIMRTSDQRIALCQNQMFVAHHESPHWARHCCLSAELVPFRPACCDGSLSPCPALFPRHVACSSLASCSSTGRKEALNDLRFARYQLPFR